MALIHFTDDLTFHLSNAAFSYALRVAEGGVLEHLYFGPAITAPPKPMGRVLRHCTVMQPGSEQLTLNALPQEYPALGGGDFGTPALHSVGTDNSVVALRYASHRILTGKVAPEGWPSARADTAQTLIVTMQDTVQGLEVDLHYTIWPDHAVIARRAVIRNIGQAPLSLRKVASTALDLPPGQYEVQHLHGTWAREFNAERLTLPTGRFVVGSARGTSSNAHAPYLAVIDSETTETQGRAIGTTLVWSGNHEMSVERGEFGRVRVVAGINPLDFDWTLEPGHSFDVPEALHAVSDAGLGGLSHVWHGFIRAHVTPQRWRNDPRPTYLNTWEAAYFDVDEAKVEAMADLATDIGVDMLVLDDGWFKGRTDDRRALGDWTADPDRFPSGIAALAKKVRAKGLKFGLWFEPEMVNPDSDLFRAYPDWIICVPEREPSLGRNQLTLDLSRPEVVDYIYGQLDAHLSSGLIDYVKWDMNRNMTEVGSGARAYRYMLGLYGLVGRLTEAYPDVLFETCASGGNRFDLGMLAYMPQGWISDMCDPAGRLSIINGASHLFPPDVMAAYIGPSPNHQNGRVSSLSARYHAGLPCAAQGVSLSATDISAYRDRLRAFVAQSKASALDRLGARFDRLRHTDNETIWQMTRADGQRVQLVAFQLMNAPNLSQRRVRLRGLDPAARYVLEGGAVDDAATFAGDQLMHLGLPLGQATGDVHSELVVLRKLS